MRQPHRICLTETLRDPHGAARKLMHPGRLYGLDHVEVRITETHLVVLWLTLLPWKPMADRDYPTERVSISIWQDRRVTAVPIDPKRRAWLHRNIYVLGDAKRMGELCLWYPSDPRRLRWGWEDGLHEYVTIVHRHLQAEEFYRRNGIWPAEDAPHGDGPHPIRDEKLIRTSGRDAA